jgi:hypothetical protein
MNISYTSFSKYQIPHLSADQAGYLRNDVLVFSDGVCYNFIGI